MEGRQRRPCPRALALALLATIDRTTGYPLLGTALLLVGVGIGLTFTVTSDIVLSSVPPEQAGAASAVSETAYELGMALGIATLGSIVTGVYQGFQAPPGTPDAIAAAVGAALLFAAAASSWWLLKGHTPAETPRTKSPSAPVEA